MSRLIIGTIIACVLVAGAVTVEAASIKKSAITRAVTLAKKTCNDVAGVIWNNKGAIAVTTAAVVLVQNPEPVIAGTTAILTGATKPVTQSNTGRIVFYSVIAVLTFLGVWTVMRFLKGWRVLPLLVVGILVLSCGAVEAGTIPAMELPRVMTIAPVWWSRIGWVIIIIATILG